MSTRTDYSSDDWAVLRDTLTRTPTLVMAVSPQGLWGLLREGQAAMSGIQVMLRAGAGYPLLADLLADLSASAAQNGASAAQSDAPAVPAPQGANPLPAKDLSDLRRETLERCRRATQILQRMAAPDEAAFYKRGLLWTCLQTASAAREGGGLFGIGSVQVTEAEQEVLRSIAFALGLPASESVVTQLPPGPPRGLPAALAGRIAAEDWAVLRQAPLWVGLAVIEADPSGPLGLARELPALMQSLEQSARRYPANPLLLALIEDFSSQLADVLHALAHDLSGGLHVQQDEGQPAISGAQAMVEHALGRLQQVAALLARLAAEARLPQLQIDELIHSLEAMAEKVAQAAREGGFLGLGGVQISAREHAALQRIQAALRQVRR